MFGAVCTGLVDEPVDLSLGYCGGLDIDGGEIPRRFPDGPRGVIVGPPDDGLGGRPLAGDPVSIDGGIAAAVPSTLLVAVAIIPTWPLAETPTFKISHALKASSFIYVFANLTGGTVDLLFSADRAEYLSKASNIIGHMSMH
jgi:hypothetical protein